MPDHCHSMPRPLWSRVVAVFEVTGIVIAGIAFLALCAGVIGLCAGVLVRAYSLASGAW